jgi:plasmid stability protein
MRVLANRILSVHWTRGTLIYVELRNVTLSLPAELVKKAKVYAAQNDTTINGVVRDLLEEAVAGKDRQRAAVAEFLAIAKQMRSRTDPGKIRRDELHERW